MGTLDEELPTQEQLLEAGIYTGETMHLALTAEQKLELEIENARHTAQYVLGPYGSEEILLSYEEARKIVMNSKTPDLSGLPF